MKIGVVIMLADSRETKGPRRYAEIKAMAQQAEAIGCDSIWLYDHLLYRFEGQPTIGIWECWTMLAALAEATRKVELGTLVVCSSFRNPALLAKMAITLDEVSQGRLILGVGAGWNQPEYEALATPSITGWIASKRLCRSSARFLKKERWISRGSTTRPKSAR
jgi:alkanesulfonate monooxygenase SsuD/methylene tetrahydromethanopterin reductase-like flavin-dependent oxidoreductase (luciferase family)